MRFLHVTHQYPPALGGAEKYIADLSEEMARRGHQVDVFTARSVDFHTWENVLPPFERRNGVNVHRFWSVYRRGSVWRMLHAGLRGYWRRRSRLYEPFIFLGGGPLCPGMFWRLLKDGPQYDLIHLNCLVYAQAAYGYWAARLRNVPVVVTPHLHPEQEVTYNIGYQRAVLTGSDYVLADTAAERDFLLAHDVALPPQRVSVVGVGLDAAATPPGDQAAARRRLGLPADGFMMLFLSRKSKYKGLELALQAFAQLQAAYPHLFFVAAGPETAESRHMWPRYRDLPNLHVLDTVSDAEKAALLQACDCLALPSQGEAFGIVYVEAWLAGKPVIGADITAVRSVIAAGEDGLLAAPGDADDLARCLRTLIDQPQLAATMGRRGREKALTRYTIGAITDRLEDVYRRTLAARGIEYG